MNKKEIINKLELIEGSLDDAFYSLPEYNANSDSRDYIDSARNELYCLKEDIETDDDKSNGAEVAKILGHMSDNGEWITDPKDDIEDCYTDYDVQFEDNFPYIKGEN
jgi:hypothetical protein